MATKLSLLLSLFAFTLGLGAIYMVIGANNDSVSRQNTLVRNAEVQPRKAHIDLKKLRQQVRRLNQRVNRLEQRFEDRTEKPKDSSPSAKEKNVNATALAHHLESVVLDRVEAKLNKRIDTVATRRRTPQGEWIAPHSELSEELDLTEDQRRRTEEIFNSAHDEIFDLLKTEQIDGSSLVDDLATDIINGVSDDVATERFIQRIFTETIPGTETKYLERLIELRSTVFADLSQELSGSQNAALETLKIDPLRVQTGYDPIKKYVEQAVTNAEE